MRIWNRYGLVTDSREENGLVHNGIKRSEEGRGRTESTSVNGLGVFRRSELFLKRYQVTLAKLLVYTSAY